MKRLLLAAAIVAASCSLAVAQGTTGAGASGGQGTSSTPSVQNPGGGMSSDKAPAKPRVAKTKKKTTKKTSM